MAAVFLSDLVSLTSYKALEGFETVWIGRLSGFLARIHHRVEQRLDGGLVGVDVGTRNFKGLISGFGLECCGRCGFLFVAHAGNAERCVLWPSISFFLDLCLLAPQIGKLRVPLLDGVETEALS